MEKYVSSTLKKSLLCWFLILQGLYLQAQTIDMDGVHAEEFFRWGVEAFHSGYFDKAIKSFESALSIKPDNTQARKWLGRAFYKSGRIEQALYEWEHITSMGMADSLLDSWIQFINFRRSLAPELLEEDRYVAVGELSAAVSYPFKRPTAVATRKDGSFYLVSWEGNELLKFDANGTLKDVLGGGIEGFNHPYDLLEIDGFLYVSEFHGNRIAKCNLKGEKISTFGTRGTGAGEFLGPQYLSSDGKGYLYVTDIGNRCFHKYDLDGNYIFTVGGKTGLFPGFALPTGIAVREEQVFVADRWHRKIFVFDNSGNYIRSLGEAQLEAPEGILFKDNRRLLIADNSRIVELDVDNETTKIIAELSPALNRIVDLGIDANENLMAVDHRANKLITYSKISTLYTGYFPQVERIDSRNFPEVFTEISVTGRDGSPIVGLSRNNFIISEAGIPVGDLELIHFRENLFPVNIIILVEKSLFAKDKLNDIQKAIEEIYNLSENRFQIKIVSAGVNPVVETDFGDSKLQQVEASEMGIYSNLWRFDEGVKKAGAELLTEKAKRIIIYLSSGNLGFHPYENHSLIELAQYLRNNAVGFYTVYLDYRKTHPDIEYLCSETGGSSNFLYHPEGVRVVCDQITERITPLYFLKYTSHSETDFGKKYIELQVTVPFQYKSGQDESGYYPPLRF